ncbi:Nn.00g029880.m01.CDS01 [Neocucurbitaria sp. VM-36]
MSSPSQSSSPQSDATQNFHRDTAQGLHLQIDFAWSKFRNLIFEKNGDRLEPVYIQHFRPTKPQLRFESVTENSHIASGTINNVSISGACTIRSHDIDLKPLKRWKTEYNYLSKTFSSSADPVPISWIANSSLKIWDFVCLDANQLPIAKFSVNLWALKQVGNIYFERSKEEISEEERDEVVVVGVTLLYIMMTRVNNPLHLLGAAFAKPGQVDPQPQPHEKVEHADKKDGDIEP